LHFENKKQVSLWNAMTVKKNAKAPHLSFPIFGFRARGIQQRLHRISHRLDVRRLNPVDNVRGHLGRGLELLLGLGHHRDAVSSLREWQNLLLLGLKRAIHLGQLDDLFGELDLAR
jgi:hypothetical protein